MSIAVWTSTESDEHIGINAARRCEETSNDQVIWTKIQTLEETRASSRWRGNVS